MRKLFWVFVLVAGVGQAQELDTLVIDTSKNEPPPYHAGIYLDGMLHFGPTLDGMNFSSSLGIGIQYEKWSLGFSQYNYLGVKEELLVFPNVFELDFRYAGAQLSYRLYDSEWIDGALQIGYYQGDMIWKVRETQQDFLRDEFSMMNISARISLDKERFAKPYLVAGYQRFSDLSLARTNNADFSGVFLGLGIRIGYFNQ